MIFNSSDCFLFYYPIFIWIFRVFYFRSRIGAFHSEQQITSSKRFLVISSESIVEVRSQLIVWIEIFLTNDDVDKCAFCSNVLQIFNAQGLSQSYSRLSEMKNFLLLTVAAVHCFTHNRTIEQTKGTIQNFFHRYRSRVENRNRKNRLFSMFLLTTKINSNNNSNISNCHRHRRRTLVEISWRRERFIPSQVTHDNNKKVKQQSEWR